MTTTFSTLTFWCEVAVLWAIWHWGWRSLALDTLRQELFQLRDELFLEAARGENGLNLTHPAYIKGRDIFNKTIQFAHRISFPLGLLLCLTRPNRGKPSRFLDELAALGSGPATTRVARQWGRATSSIGKYLLKVSPTLLVMVLATLSVMAVLSICRFGFSHLRDLITELPKLFKEPVIALENEASEFSV